MTTPHPQNLDVEQFVGARLIDVRYATVKGDPARTWFLYDNGRAIVVYASGSIWVHARDEAPEEK